MSPLTRRNWAFDSAIAAVAVVLGQLEVWDGFGATHRQGPHWAQALAYTLCGLVLVLRRARPMEVLVAVAVVQVGYFMIFGSPEGNGVGLAPIIAMYSVARWERRYRPAWGLVLGLSVGLAWIGFDPMDTVWSQRVASLFWASQSVIAWLVGALVRARLQTREQRRLREVEVRERAAAEERNRVARELHDVVGHNITVMTLHASAVRRRLAPDQVEEREALETVERSGREAMTEMRRMVAVLRQEGDATQLAPAPGLADLDGLVARIESAGLPVDVAVSGERRALAAGIDLTAYRLIQEGLTNALRHANRPTRAAVRLTYEVDRLGVEVVDDGGAVNGVLQPGHGLLGLRERVSVHGGHLSVRPRPVGGFELVAELPLEDV